ncbi:hypothetical protein FO440_04205 [Mucilaginibacter corticis]|uniref:Uncharacterized protein n=1 Tax=Mucilaginibacter corticis TaxID=2597670 RepID=A0A556MU37_9SPHI|nr:hypothetical protein [Mucilaginibacter corticis]TSJ43403.1 hypothetical protein FO440_04205 [Mucilaginibacter corticis]
MKKLNVSYYIILIAIATFFIAGCSKDSDSGTAIFLGDLAGFWQSGNDSFTFQQDNGQLDGSGEIGGRSGEVTNGVFSKTTVTFNLVFDDDKSVRSYKGTIDKTKKILTLTSSAGKSTFTKQ